jgi:hypothetical protein
MRLLWVILGILVGAGLGASGNGQAQAQRPRAAESILPLPPPPTPPAPPMRMAPPGPPVAAVPPAAAPGRPAPAPAPPPQAARPGAPARGAQAPVIWATIYAAAPPARAYGVSPATANRLAAHQRAEAQCRAGPGGNTCRRLVEIQQGCAALIQGARDDRLLPWSTADPNQPVMLAVSGAGFTVEDATRDGMDQCQRRQRGAVCRVIATVCTR